MQQQKMASSIGNGGKIIMYESGDGATKLAVQIDGETEPSLPSSLQVAIDRKLKGAELLLVLCGSNEGFMESKVLGRKSPLYGRRTAQMRLGPLDYHDAAKMIPSASTEDKAEYYATFGGTPYYVEQIDCGLSYEENVAELFFSISGLLYEEPLMLLRQELREPALYNSILDALGSGANRPKEMAERAGIPNDSMSKYLATLESLGLIAKTIPFGENPATSRKGIYSLKDPLFAYWYRFVSRNVGAIEAGGGAAVLAADGFGAQVVHGLEGADRSPPRTIACVRARLFRQLRRPAQNFAHLVRFLCVRR